ncbi:hypothetical protein E2562_037019 [Oryza meyeriana var. granulata]|uniref:Uncharacterized protein n=1 Tax=Oryza meyeriana var. granulata TaxID=110450 RepID=A0A6G1CJV1_9ORYZ|nr:hypothetical protein E2562_037019 [Oryza meyeriana var. granulata]
MRLPVTGFRARQLGRSDSFPCRVDVDSPQPPDGSATLSTGERGRHGRICTVDLAYEVLMGITFRVLQNRCISSS